jgi:hypothetical protein
MERISVGSLRYSRRSSGMRGILKKNEFRYVTKYGLE